MVAQLKRIHTLLIELRSLNKEYNFWSLKVRYLRGI